MNKMTIIFLVLFVALLSFGTRVYAQEKKDSVKVEQTTEDNKVVLNDSILKVQVDSLQAVIKTMSQQFMEMQQEKNIFSFLSVKKAVVILLCLVLILLLLQVLALTKLADKVSKRRLKHNFDELNAKIHKVKEEAQWNNVQADNKRKEEKRYGPPASQQRRDPYAGQRPADTSQQREQTKKEEPKKPEKRQRIEKTIYCRNNEGDLLVPPYSDTKDDATTFIIEFDPEDKSNLGILSYVGNIHKFRSMNQESLKKAFTIEFNNCTLADATVVEMSKPGQVLFNKNDQAWTITIPIKVTLKK